MQYNINPLALSARHYVLVKYAGIMLPPLELGGTVITVGRFQLPTVGRGAYELSPLVVAGRFQAATDLRAAYELSPLVVAGRFALPAALHGWAAVDVYLTVGRFSLRGGVRGGGGTIMPVGRFALPTALRGDIVLNPPQIITGLRYRTRWFTPSRRWQVAASRVEQQIYLCRLTAPNLPDLPLPIASVQARMRDGEPTYCAVVVPGITTDLITAIDQYVGLPDNAGRLRVLSGVRTRDGQEIVEPLINAALDSARYEQGGRSGSATLVGYVVNTTLISKVERLEGVQVLSRQGNGKHRIRSLPSHFLQAGDVAVYGDEPGESLIAGMISLLVTPSSAQMDITER